MSLQGYLHKLHFFSKSPLKQDVLWTFASQILIMVCAFIITKLVSNAFTVEEFGLFNVVKRSASVLSFVMLAGMGITLPRYLPIYKSCRHYNSVIDLLWISILFVLLVSVIIFGIGLYYHDLGMEMTNLEDKGLFFLMFLYAFSITISSLLFAYYRGLNDFRKYSISQVFLQIVLILSVLFVYGKSVASLFLFWSILGLLLPLGYVLYEIRKSRFVILHCFSFQRIRRRAKDVVGYSLPRLVGDFFLFSFSAFPVVYLSGVRSMSDVAYFSVGLTILNMATPVFSFLGVVLLPYVSGAIAKGTFVEADRFIKKMFLLYLVLSTIICLLFGLFMPFIIKLFFSAEYLQAQEMSKYMMFAVIPQSLYLLYRNPIDAISVMPYNTFILLISFALLIIFFYTSTSLTDYTISFVLASAVQGGLSWIAWIWLRNRITLTSKVK